MKLVCRGLRSLTDATIEIGPGLTLVIGANGSGKSSAALAAGALLTRDGKLGRTKDDRGRGLVADGARGAVVSLRSEGGHIEINWPDGEVLQKGEAPAASRIAAGLDRPAAVDAKTRAAMLIASLKAEPTEQEWMAACAASREAPASTSGTTWSWTGDDLAAVAWGLIARDGWDAAVKSLGNDGRAAKALWCHLTGSRAYQSTGAATWQPEGYQTEDLIDADIGENEELVERTRHQRDMILAAQAVGAAERARLSNLARQRSRIDEDELPQAQAAVHEAEDNVSSWDKRLQFVDMAHTVCPCPYCDQPIAIWPEIEGDTFHGGPLLRKPTKVATVDEVTLAEWRGKQDGAKRDLENAQLELQQSLSRQMAAREAEETLAGLPPLDPQATARAELEWDTAKARLDAINATVAARQEHEKIQALAAAIKLAAPEGLRQQKLAQTIYLVNNGMAELCRIAEWPWIAINSALELVYGGRGFADLSESERWRVETVLAIQVARLDGSDLVVLDRADVLDGHGRNGLLNMTAAAEVPILAFMTAPKSQGAAIMATGCNVFIMADGRVNPPL